MATKSDLSNAISPKELQTYFRLSEHVESTLADVRVEACCALDGAGVKPGVEWLAEYMWNHVKAKEDSQYL